MPASPLAYTRKQHSFADEGNYYTVNNAQTGLQGQGTAFVATTPYIIVFNSAAVNTSATIYIDYLLLTTTAAGSAASGLALIQYALVVDTGNRLSSGGTTLTSKNVFLRGNTPAVTVTAGTPLATAASGSVVTVRGLGVFRPTASGTVADVVGETKYLTFGGVEGVGTGTVTAASVNTIDIPAPPIAIPPQSSFLVYLWQATGATNVAASYAPELGFWIR